MPLLALVTKEWLLLWRDRHALLLLFAMPAAFILVMSLALQNKFALQQGVSIPYYLVNEDHSPQSEALVQRLESLQNFKSLTANGSMAHLRACVQRDRVQFLVRIPRGFGAAMDSHTPLPVQMLAGPGVEPAVYELFAVALRAALARVVVQQSLRPLKAQLRSQAAAAAAMDVDSADQLLLTESLYREGGHDRRPSSVQQNVPAWLLFAMFFIAVPLSTTWVQERQLGTYARLHSMGLRSRTLLAGKLLPYLGINLLQVILMLGVGVFVVPWLGGDRLTLGHAPLALTLMALAVSFASVTYALLIANLVSTSDQAMIFTGVANLLMAALGGIMVPSLLMPPLMQTLSHFSPMAWGLEGFLDVFLREGGFVTVAREALWLFLFGMACLLLAGWRLNARRR
ncbi:MAG: ABC transporter permease [Gammaproteobacteria bacterium]